MCSSPHFDDEERLRVLVMMSAQELSNGISYSGHIYAMARAGRSLTPTADLYETLSGMDQVSYSHQILHDWLSDKNFTLEGLNCSYLHYLYKLIAIF